jgi:hypothetical protein
MSDSVKLTINGLVVYETGAITAPPPGPPVVVPPPPPPPTGNPGAILPPLPWPEGQSTSDVQHIRQPNGSIFTYEVPPLHAGSAVVFTQGQDTNTQGGCVTEFSVSQTPGVIDPSGEAGGYYQKTANIQNNNMALYYDGRMPYVPPQNGKWYINIRWTNPSGNPNGFSVQWAPGA